MRILRKNRPEPARSVRVVPFLNLGVGVLCARTEPMLLRSFILKTAALKPIERMVRGSRLFRGLVGRFIAGDTLDEALRVSEKLAERGFQVSLDYLGENTHTMEEARHAVDTYLDMLRRIAKSPCAPVTNISIKLTQCGLDLGEDVAEGHFREVLWTAQEVGNFVRIDMEGSDYTARTIAMMQRVWPDFQNTGTVLQAYLHRTPEDIQTMIDLQMRTRIVKGAYLEPASVALPEKTKVDDAYVAGAQRLMKEGFYPALATHDEKIIRALKAFAQTENIAPERFEFQMLYGIRRDLQESLLKEGYRVRVYIPFGDSWYPYFSRRLAESPSNLLFIVKAIFRG
jgi:proline dehydrogenase